MPAGWANTALRNRPDLQWLEACEAGDASGPCPICSCWRGAGSLGFRPHFLFGGDAVVRRGPPCPVQVKAALGQSCVSSRLVCTLSQSIARPGAVGGRGLCCAGRMPAHFAGPQFGRRADVSAGLLRRRPATISASARRRSGESRLLLQPWRDASPACQAAPSRCRLHAGRELLQSVHRQESESRRMLSRAGRVAGRTRPRRSGAATVDSLAQRSPGLPGPRIELARLNEEQGDKAGRSAN